MSEDLQARLAAVQKAIFKRPPFVSGTLDVPESDLKLYFGEVDDAHCLNLARATEEQLAKLTAACDPATFGVKQKDVLDEFYRKAGKLDADKFASLLKVAEYGLIDMIRDELLKEGADSTKQIVCELYKLNVYEKDSFFKSHKDTPRSERMFGSLVVVLPTPHEGGALVLREEGRDWTFDYAAEIANVTKIAYVAFRGDIEHEVLTVKSGYRATLTYNLYFDAAKAQSITSTAPDSKPIPRSVAFEDAQLSNALRSLLQVPGLLQNGGYLAFGLRYKYPCDQDTALQQLLSQLKGADAMVHRACKALNTEGRLKVAYRDDVERDDVFIIRDNFFGHCYVQPGDNFSRMLFECDSELTRAMGSRLIEDYASENYPGDGAEEVLWVTPFSEYTSVKEVEAGYNSKYVHENYAYLAYFVTVPRYDMRSDATVDLDSPTTKRPEAAESSLAHVPEGTPRSHTPQVGESKEEYSAGTLKRKHQSVASAEASDEPADHSLGACTEAQDEGLSSPPRKRPHRDLSP